jgi:acetyltransferase
MSLDKFFNPESVAIVGASNQKGKVGYEIVLSMLNAGYKGKIYPVNPNVDSIENLKCHPDLASIGQTPDLVLITVPAPTVPDIMQQCVKIHAKAAVIIAAGFKEIGSKGAALEKRVVQIARTGGIRIIGPNCLGVINPAKKLNASFAGELPLPGSVGYLSQSGALLSAILDMANTNLIGFSKLISIGNKADVDELEVIKDLGDDEDTRVIAGYLENIGEGTEFVREAERISHDKPILLMKSGGTPAGARAASSHMGSLAGEDTAYECVFERAGIVRCRSIETQFAYAQAFANQPLPKGASVAVITNAGGAGIMAADAIERQGLNIAQLSDTTIEKLKTKLPPEASFENPIDILGDALADRYEFALDVIHDDPAVDIMLVLLAPQAVTQVTETAAAIVKTNPKNKDKPILTCFLGAQRIEEAIKVLRAGRVPQYNSPESAVETIRVMCDYVKWRQQPKRVVKLFPVNRRKVEAIVGRNVRKGLAEIPRSQATEILEAYGFVTLQASVANTPDQAADIAERIGYPVVLKIWAPDIPNKGQVGGIKVGLKNAAEVKDAFDLMMYRIPKKVDDVHILGVLVQQMCPDGREVILAMKRDPHFGPLMMFGMGGAMVEVLKDVSFHLAPLTDEEARQMLMNTQTYRILEGVGGHEAVDIDAIAEALQRLSQLVTEFPQIQEMEISPFMVGPYGTSPVAVDATISIEQL